LNETVGTDVTQERQQAHVLADMLPQEKLTAVRSLLEVMVKPPGAPPKSP